MIDINIPQPASICPMSIQHTAAVPTIPTVARDTCPVGLGINSIGPGTGIAVTEGGSPAPDFWYMLVELMNDRPGDGATGDELNGTPAWCHSLGVTDDDGSATGSGDTSVEKRDAEGGSPEEARVPILTLPACPGQPVPAEQVAMAGPIAVVEGFRAPFLASSDGPGLCNSAVTGNEGGPVGPVTGIIATGPATEVIAMGPATLAPGPPRGSSLKPPVSTGMRPEGEPAQLQEPVKLQESVGSREPVKRQEPIMWQGLDQHELDQHELHQHELHQQGPPQQELYQQGRELKGPGQQWSERPRVTAEPRAQGGPQEALQPVDRAIPTAGPATLATDPPVPGESQSSTASGSPLAPGMPVIPGRAIESSGPVEPSGYIIRHAHTAEYSGAAAEASGYEAGSPATPGFRGQPVTATQITNIGYRIVTPAGKPELSHHRDPAPGSILSPGTEKTGLEDITPRPISGDADSGRPDYKGTEPVSLAAGNLHKDGGTHMDGGQPRARLMDKSAGGTAQKPAAGAAVSREVTAGEVTREVTRGVVIEEESLLTAGRDNREAGIDPGPVTTGSLHQEIASGIGPGLSAHRGDVDNSGARAHGSTRGMPDANPQVDARGVAWQVVEKAAIRIRQGASQVIIQLRPESLGRVHLRIVEEGSAVNIGIRAENNATKSLIEAGLSELKTALAQHGIRVDRVNVAIAPGNLDMMAGGNFSFSRHGDRNPMWPASFGTGLAYTAEASTPGAGLEGKTGPSLRAKAGYLDRNV
ncbi:MAG TPA: hypothetical protein GX506_10310 [Firmicutes bacterium]|nr:hypothetical protein [Bacillota bacterium]